MDASAAVRRVTGATVLAAAGLLLAACAPADPADPAERSPERMSALTGELTVYAAASLMGAFDEIAAGFAAENPGVTVKPTVYGGSSALVAQLAEGAPGDVFASADEATMATAAEAGLLAVDAALVATNTLVIVVPDGNPANVQTLQDLARSDVLFVRCAPEVPYGAASERLLAAAGVEAQPVSLEQNVAAVLTKVSAGEADAGLVYRTDLYGREDVESIVPEGALEVVNRYQIAPLADASNPVVASAFAAYVTAPRSQAVLAKYGFGAP